MKLSRTRSSAGFSLVEVLVAVVVLSVSLLGVAALQLKAMQSTHLSYQRSLATVIAADASERLWASLGASAGVCPVANLSTINTEWLGEWKDKLPDMDDNSKVEHQGDCEFLITVTWQDERFAGESDVSTLTYFTRLPVVI